MDLKNNQELKEVREKFALLEHEGIISTDEDWYGTGEETEEDEDDEDISTEEEFEDLHSLESKEELADSGHVTFSSSIEDSCTYKLPKLAISKEPEASSRSRDFEAYYNAYADQFIRTMNRSPTTYHFVTHFKSVLDNNGFTEVKEKDYGDYSKPGFYYVTKDDQTLVAFVVGGKWEPLKGSIFVGTHVDALSVKVRSKSSIKPSVNGYELLGVAPYSGSLGLHWLDRDLGLSGSVLVKDENGKVYRKLISTGEKPVATIPSLAEHFAPLSEPNQATQAVPIIGLSQTELEPTEEEKASQLYSKHSLALLRLVTTLADVKISDIVDLDLELVNVQPAVRGGLSSEFVYASSLDDRLCSFSAIYGLLEFSKTFLLDRNIEDYDGLTGVYFANHEEIGSKTTTGAGGGFLRDTLSSIISSRNLVQPTEKLAQLFTNTIILSSDVTHALNPNYKYAYLEGNFPVPNTGPSVKFDVNKHVLSDPEGWVFLNEIVDAHLPGIKLQQFHIRNDGRSGGTIGPIMGSGDRGINGAALIIDVGLPILAMHGFRSSVGYKDIGMGVRFFREVYAHYLERTPIVEED